MLKARRILAAYVEDTDKSKGGGNRSLNVTWKQGPALIEGPAVGIVDGRFLVAGGMSYPRREAKYGFWL
jgi:hypothetical protein